MRQETVPQYPKKSMHTLRFEQTIQSDIQTTWEFICNPHNLNRITPHDLEFEIVSDAPQRIFNGLLLEYRIKIPYLGKRRWVTEIKHIRTGTAFVDEQRIGPYTFWYHYHEIEAVDHGVRLTDKISFAIPHGMLGKLLDIFFIRKTLIRIFNFRKSMFKQILESHRKERVGGSSPSEI